MIRAISPVTTTISPVTGRSCAQADEAGPRVRGIVARPLKRPKVEFPVYVAWRKDTPEKPFLDAMLETAPKA